MPVSSLASVAQSAGEELARRLCIPCDIVDVHRGSNSRKKIYASLRYGAFLLAYAPLEGFFSTLTSYADRNPGRALPLNLDKIQRELDSQWPDAKFQSNLWEGRTRQHPTRAGKRSEWAHLRNKRLKDYMSDMKALRDLLSHGGDPYSVTNDARTLWPLSDGRWSLRLMGVEGFIKFAEDLAEQALLEAGVLPEILPSWPEPQRSGISMTGLPPLPNRDRLAKIRLRATQELTGFSVPLSDNSGRTVAARLIPVNLGHLPSVPTEIHPLRPRVPRSSAPEQRDANVTVGVQIRRF